MFHFSFISINNPTLVLNESTYAFLLSWVLEQIVKRWRQMLGFVYGDQEKSSSQVKNVWLQINFEQLYLVWCIKPQEQLYLVWSIKPRNARINICCREKIKIWLCSLISCIEPLEGHIITYSYILNSS